MSRPVAGTRADYVTFRSIQTRWLDNDAYGHMNNAIHYQLFDTAVNGHLIDNNLLDLKAGKTVFLVVDTGCHYYGEMAFPDVIHAGLRVEKLGGSSVRYEVGLFRNDEDTASAEGHFVHVNVGRQSRRPEPIAETARQALAALML